MRKSFVAGLGTLVLALALAGPAQADVIVVDPHSVVAGKTIGAWTADWWNWVGSFPRETSPIHDGTGQFANMHQSGPVFFVGGSRPGPSEPPQPVDRTFTVPGDKYLLFPLINWIVGNGVDDGAFPDTRAEARAVTSGTIDPARLFFEIDGVPITGLANHREETPDFFTVTVTDDLPAIGGPGTFTDAFADGYWIMLAPLGGESHVFHFGGTTMLYTSPSYPPPEGFKIDPFSLDMTARVTAIPEPSAWALSGLGVFILLVWGWQRRDRSG
jgi:hypothetical protein